MKKVMPIKQKEYEYYLFAGDGTIKLKFTEDQGSIEFVSIVWLIDDDEIDIKRLFDSLEFHGVDLEVIYDKCYSYIKNSGPSPQERNRIFKDSMDSFLARRNCD